MIERWGAKSASARSELFNSAQNERHINKIEGRTTNSRLWTVLCLTVWMLSGTFAVGADEKQPLSPEQVTAALQRYVLAQSAWRPEQVEIVLGSSSLPLVAAGVVDFVVLKPNRGVTPGLHRFLMSARVNGKEEARFWVDADLHVFAEVVVTSQPLAHYEPISLDKVRLERRDLGQTPLQPVTSLEGLEGKQAAYPIAVNQVVTVTMVESPRVIRRGGAITLVYESAGLRVETPGRAAEPGRVGDHIRVENPSSGKVVDGQVLDEKTVKVN